MRADELLMQLSIIERRQEIKLIIREKRLLVDGLPLDLARWNLDPQIQEIYFDGQLIKQPVHHYLMLNKPLKTISANSDVQYPVVMDLLKSKFDVTNFYTVGRLDFLTTGLLLITDNGPLGLSMLHPNNHVLKSYLITTKEPLDLADIAKFSAGLIIDQATRTRPAKLEIIDSHQAKVTIDEGKNRQLRKMFLTVGKKVETLHRVSFGPLELDKSLAEGEYRELTKEERYLLKKFF